MTIITPQQILVPKKVYIGDRAELRCTFNSPNPALKELTLQGQGQSQGGPGGLGGLGAQGGQNPQAAQGSQGLQGITKLPLVSQSNTEDYVIKEVTLAPAGVDFYQLTVTFVPWKTGEITFPPMEIEGTEVIIEFQPLQIVSLITAENAATTTLHDTAAPLLLPGTAYRLYGALAAIILVLIIAIRLFVKHKSLIFYINNKKLLKKYKKNKKQAKKALYKIADTAGQADFNAKTAAEDIQKVLRNYLEVRFGYPFTRTVTSEIMAGWQSVTGGLCSEKKEEAFGEIAAAFIRTDYIRYRKGGAFEKDELVKLVEKLVLLIETLEKPEEADA